MQNIKEMLSGEEANKDSIKEILVKAVKSKVRGKQVEEQSKLNRLRLEFNSSLAKLAVSSTKEVGFHELQKLIAENHTPQALRVYLGQLGEGHQSLGAGGKELHVLLLGHVAKTCREEMVDPIDKPASLEKTVARVCSIVRKYLAVVISVPVGSFPNSPSCSRTQSHQCI